MLTLYILSGFVIISALLPFIKQGLWWIRIFDFPRLQFLFLNLVCLAWLLCLEATAAHGGLTFGLCLALVADLRRIIPYTPFYPKEVKNSQQTNGFKFLSSNIFIKNKNFEALKTLIEDCDPDFFLLLETDAWWNEKCQAFHNAFPYYILQPQDNTYGMLFFSKHEIENHDLKFLVDDDVPSLFIKLKLKNDKKLTVIGIHPRPPRPSEGDSDQRDAELMHVAEYVKEHKDETIVVIGDLNDVAWSHTTRLFLRVSGLLDPRRGRGFYNTFSVKWPIFRFPLDHIFHSKTLSFVELRLLNDIGSDHFPILAHLAFEPRVEKQKSRKHPDKEDQEEARDLKEKGEEWDGPEEEVKE